MKNDDIQAFKNAYIYTVKKDNILYSTLENEYNFPV